MKIGLVFVLAFLVAVPARGGVAIYTPGTPGAQSTITESEGYACMSEDKSRKQTEDEALASAKKNAAEYVLTYIKSEKGVKNESSEKDLIEAYAHASVKVIEVLAREWTKDPVARDCFRIRIKAEVIPECKGAAE